MFLSFTGFGTTLQGSKKKRGGRRALVSPRALNEGENISARCYFNKEPAVVHLSVSLIFSRRL